MYINLIIYLMHQYKLAHKIHELATEGITVFKSDKIKDLIEGIRKGHMEKYKRKYKSLPELCDFFVNERKKMQFYNSFERMKWASKNCDSKQLQNHNLKHRSVSYFTDSILLIY